MAFTLAPLILALATSTASEPSIELVPGVPTAQEAPTTRCAVAAPDAKAGAGDVECVVEQARPGAASEPIMRITVRSSPPSRCRATEALTVAMPGPTPAAGGAIPAVVNGAPAAACAR
jgi:hypothetical protein